MYKFSNEYYKRNRIIDLLKEAINSKITYVFAPIGTGKTIAIKQLEESENKKFYWFNLNNYEKNDTKIDNIKTDTIIIIDDYNNYNDNDKEKIIRFMENQNNNHFIILSRKPMDSYIKNYYYTGNLTLITMSDLNFTKDEILDYFKINNIEISNNELQQLIEDNYGYSLVINMLIQYLKKENYTIELANRIKKQIVEYIEYNVFKNIDIKILDFIEKISLINDIDENSVNYILNIEDAALLLKNAENQGGFLYEEKYGKYQFIEVIRDYFQEKELEKLKEHELHDFYIKASEYYEKIEINIVYAAEYYILAKEYETAAILLKNQTILHLGIINYREIEKYILEIPIDVIEEYPELCIILAHIFRINEKNEKAQYWFNNFEDIRKKYKDNPEEYDKLNQMKLYYLICMPSTNDIQLLDYFKLLRRNMKEHTILDTITFTGNQPSVLSGGKDLSNWGKHYKVVYPLISKLVFEVFKENQSGSGEIALAEYLYLNNKIDESMKYISKAINICQNDDLFFALYSLLDKIGSYTGNITSYIEDFKSKISNKTKYLEINYNARIIEKDILLGNLEKIRNWIYDCNINIIEKFNVLNRYSYFIYARALISLEKYTESLIVLERLYIFAVKYKRKIYEIEYFILKSINMFRINEKEKAFECITEAINLANKYDYVRLFADEGKIIDEILSEYEKSKYANKNIIKDKFYKEIHKESIKYGELFPKKYLKNTSDILSLFTKKEIEILDLMKQGKTNKEICEEQSVSLATVKTHINHIYCKLDTKNRVQTLNKLKEIKDL